MGCPSSCAEDFQAGCVLACSCNLRVLVRIDLKEQRNLCFWHMHRRLSSPDTCSIGTSTQHPKRAVAMQQQPPAAAPAPRLQTCSLHPAAAPAPKLQSTAYETYVGPSVLLRYFAVTYMGPLLGTCFYGAQLWVFVGRGKPLIHATPPDRIRMHASGSSVA